MTDYGLDLNVEEQMAIVGPGALSCDVAGFNEELAAQILAEKMESCLQYPFVGCDSSPNGICPESFNFVETGNAYTCEINSISFKYFGAENFTRHIGTLCIQVSNKKSDGKAIDNPLLASDMMSQIWNSAHLLQVPNLLLLITRLQMPSIKIYL